MTTTSKNIIWALIIVAVLAVAFYIMKPNENSQEARGRKVDSVPGLDITVLQEGSGPEIQNGQIAAVNYIGTFENGTVFDSSIPRGEPITFTLGAGQVIKGWDFGILGMKVGEKRRLIISPELAYGDAGAGPIPPNSTLIFEVELLGIR